MSLELKKDEVRVLERFWDDGQYSRVLRDWHRFWNACVAVVPSGQLAGHPCKKVSGILYLMLLWAACCT